MKILEWRYNPAVYVEFSWTEVESMILLSERHYDYKCRELSQQGGTLYGMRNKFTAVGKGASIEWKLDFSDVDLLAKTCEADPAMLYKMMPIVKALADKYNELNPRSV